MSIEGLKVLCEIGCGTGDWSLEIIYELEELAANVPDNYKPNRTKEEQIQYIKRFING